MEKRPRSWGGVRKRRPRKAGGGATNGGGIGDRIAKKEKGGRDEYIEGRLERFPLLLWECLILSLSFFPVEELESWLDVSSEEWAREWTLRRGWEEPEAMAEEREREGERE